MLVFRCVLRAAELDTAAAFPDAVSFRSTVPGARCTASIRRDCCQALKVNPRDKYQRDGGPGMRQLMDLLSGYGCPSEDRDRFMRACAFNFVIAGTDAHAKNYSLLLAAGGRYRLAPLYDIASWLPYSKDRRADHLATSVGKQYFLEDTYPRHWEDEARNLARVFVHTFTFVMTAPRTHYLGYQYNHDWPRIGKKEDAPQAAASSLRCHSRQRAERLDKQAKA